VTTDELTLADFFCGAGGSSTGAVQVPGVRLRAAANHWQLACDTHAANHPGADHIVADLSQYDPRYFPRTVLGWFSPECFTAGHLVTTTRGQVPIEAVRVGDLVLTHTGRWQPVVRTQARLAETVTVRGQGHPGITTTASHQFLLMASRLVWNNSIRQYRRSFDAPAWAPIGEAVRNEALWATPVSSDKLPIPRPPAALGPDPWWIIGRWVGDGSLTFGRNHEVLLACGYHQADELEHTLSRTGTTWARSDKRTAAVFSIGDRESRDWLHDHFGHGAASKQMPSWALSLPPGSRADLLDGYMSADGHTSKRGDRVASTVSRALFVSVRLLAESLGYRVSAGMDKRTAYTIEGRTGAALQQWIVRWPTTTSPARSPEAFEHEGHAWSRVRSISRTGETEMVYNIEIAGDHSYVLDGIVVKNCTWHSGARGKRYDGDTAQPDLLGETLPIEAAERSRTTMWDVVRFTEYHRYQAVFVENVVEIFKWPPVHAWLAAMEALGYRWKVVSLNAMHAQARGLPAPQSRDRVYVVFWRKGNRAPDLNAMQRPPAWCPTCDEVVQPLQTWKAGRTVGKYRQQYAYRCPKHSCRGQVVEPGCLPAASFIDWTNLGQRIGDRQRPLKSKTRARIAAGIEKYWAPFMPSMPLLVAAAGQTYDAAHPAHPRHGDPSSYWRAWPVTDPSRTVHTTQAEALVIPVEGRAGLDTAKSTDGPLRAMTTRNETGLALPPFIAEMYGTGGSRAASDPLSTVTAGGFHHALITAYYGQGGAQTAADPLSTVTTHDRRALITPAGSAWGQGAYPTSDPSRTVTTYDVSALVTEGPTIDVDDCWFRMLEPAESKLAMAFPRDYRMLGTRREQQRMAGNAVVPPAARDLVWAVAESLDAA
jgi:DNA (cytosine-5)-methyltransferase 1